MPGPADLMAALKAKQQQQAENTAAPPNLAAALAARQKAAVVPGAAAAGTAAAGTAAAATKKKPSGPPLRTDMDKSFQYDKSLDAFLLFADGQKVADFVPTLVDDEHGNAQTDILIPLAPCAYRMCDYTLSKREPLELRRCVLKLGVLRCLQRECKTLNDLLWHRFSPSDSDGRITGTMEEDELGKVRFMELLSNCGVYQKVAELILQRTGQVLDAAAATSKTNGNGAVDTSRNPYRIPQIRVDELDEFLAAINELYPALQQAREEITESQTVSFFPGLGELFCPGSMLLSYPEGMEGSPLGCSCVQSWYVEELNKATNKMKRRFVLVVEFIVSVGDELVFVAASDVYPEFHDTSRNQPIRDLTHRKLSPDTNADDKALLQRLQRRGEFYASVATKNHYLEYYPDSFFPIIGGGWNSNAVRPLSKGGRVMVDVKRGILEGHMPVRGSSSDGMSDTVKEAIKLFEQSKRTGVAVPFRTAILPDVEGTKHTNGKNGALSSLSRGDSDRASLWQAWPMLTGFSFTARVWGKLLLGMPKAHGNTADSSIAPASSSSCGYINFREKAFEQLVLAEDKKELIRAVARNAGGGGGGGAEGLFGEDIGEDYDDDDDDDDDVGLDVVANKGGASIFLLHGPPGCGKTLTAEAISELLKKPLYIVTAGDLGITASEVEKTLGAVLDLCQTWDALVLIDEADIFLEARTSKEIQRNALVCVILRLLEYYSGCLFLSSNRAASSIDPAIASRITVMLGYPPLDVHGRTKVWKNLVDLVPVQPVDATTGQLPEKIAKNPRRAARYRVDFSNDDYSSLGSDYELNGRQIKNSIVLARALARERGTPLSLAILRRAVTAVAGKQEN